MKPKHMILPLAMGLSLMKPSLAQVDDSLVGPELGQPGLYTSMDEAAWDWRPGDLIFRNGLNPRDELIRDAEGGIWASVGILRAASGDPRVVYVDEELGVTESMLDEFVAGLSPEDYAVFRVPALDANTVPGQQMEMGPMARYALFIAYGFGYDPLMTLGNGQFYNAELPYVAAMNAGVILAEPVTLGQLSDDNTALRDALLSDWQHHPHCNVQTSKEECWGMIRSTAVITPGMLIGSERVIQIFPGKK